MATILYGILSWFLQQLVLKAVVYGVLFLFITQAISFLQTYLFTGDNGISAAIQNMGGSFTVLGQSINTTNTLFWFCNYFMLAQWLQTVLVAYATVFLIRRIPFIN